MPIHCFFVGETILVGWIDPPWRKIEKRHRFSIVGRRTVVVVVVVVVVAIVVVVVVVVVVAVAVAVAVAAAAAAVAVAAATATAAWMNVAHKQPFG